MAKYKITVEGGDNNITDSMSVVFNKQRVKVILYLPDLKRPGHVVEQAYIDDFNARKSITLNAENNTYKIDTLNTPPRYNFVNTRKIVESNNSLCFQYKADSTKLDRSQISEVECVAAIDYSNSLITTYFFLGIQPVIIDNRIVMDFIVTKRDGVKQRIYVYDIKKMNNVNFYFNLAGYKQAQ